MSENLVAEETQPKSFYRKKVWENLEKNNLVNFPRPCYHRIPNFKGCEETALKVAELDVFKTSQNVMVNPDKPQEPIRLAVLENQKNLYVPVPRLDSGLLKHILVGENPLKDDLRKAVSRRGIVENGKDIGIEDEVKIDLVILGSVAVSREGYRIGKGKGYADLEYAILTQMKALNKDTVIVTTVHDSQVFDTLPAELFQAYDVPVDIIITPTEVIFVEDRLPKPTGIIWNILSQRRIDMMPILKLLRDIDENDGRDVTLKEVESDMETRDPQRRKYRNHRNNRRRRLPDRESKSSENQGEDDKENEKRPTHRRRNNRRPKDPKTEQDGEKVTTNSEGESKSSARRRPKQSLRKKQIDFSLVVRNIERSMRVRDMKEALAERGVKPRLITWRGFKGYCCLHFAKTTANTEEEYNVDNMIGLLQNLKITPQATKQLSIEVMRPISRIEVTDVTAV